MKEAETTSKAAVPERPGAKNRAFLVQLAPDCQPAAGDIHGRVQHLDTADGGNFATVSDLVAIVARILSREEPD